MYKKVISVLLSFAVGITLTYGQENESILSAPDNWQREIIPFPLGFAPGIDFVGFEDLRFAPGWSDSTSQEFWSYSFAWYIEMGSSMTESILTESFILYYDGLMGVVSNNQADTTNSNPLDKTICLFVKTNEGFSGKMRVYDAFFKHDYFTLNIKVKESFCLETKKQVIFCNISPKSFDNEVWEIFNDVRLKVKCD